MLLTGTLIQQSTSAIQYPITVVQNISSSSEMTNSQPLRVTIAELLRYDRYNRASKRFQCEAHIVNIKNQHSWCHHNCSNCHKNLKKDGVHQAYRCDNCKTLCQRPVLMYFLCLEVFDYTETTEFKLFDKEAEQLVGVPASRVRHEPNPHNYLLPPSVKSVIGKTVTFTVKFDSNSKRGCVSFIVCKVNEVPPDAQHPANVTPLPCPRREIAESSRHAARDKGKRKVDESLPAQRQLEDEPDSTRPAKRPFISSHRHQSRR